MQKIMFSLVLSLLFLVTNSQDLTRVVGKLDDNGDPVLTINKAQAISSLTSNLLRLSGLEVNFTDLAIVRNDDGYLLLFTGTTWVSSFYVQADGSTLRAAVGTTCTTSECSQETRGCVVKQVTGDNYYCTPCNNKGKCTKTSSSDSLMDVVEDLASLKKKKGV